MSGLMELRPLNLYMMPWDQALDGDVAVAKARGPDLRAEDPTAQYESEGEQAPEQSGIA